MPAPEFQGFPQGTQIMPVPTAIQFAEAGGPEGPMVVLLASTPSGVQGYFMDVAFAEGVLMNLTAAVEHARSQRLLVPPRNLIVPGP